MVDFDHSPETLPSSRAQEIQRLALASLIGAADEQDVERLDQLVCDDAASRRYYVRCMQTACHLRTLARVAQADAAAEKGALPLVDLTALAEIMAAEGASFDGESPDAVPQVEPVRSFWRRGLDKLVPETIAPWTHPYRFTAVAVVLTVGFWLGIAGFLHVMGWRGASVPQVAQSSREELPLVVAKIEASLDCDWDGVARDATPVLRQGQEIHFLAGLLEIRYRSGASVILEGPATYTLADTNAGRLDRGRLTARVPTAAQGFVVATPAGEVTDLGTEFGIVVEEDGPAMVQVFQGMVLLAQRDARGTLQHSVYLEAGQAVRVRADSVGSEFVKSTVVPRLARHVPTPEERNAAIQPYPDAADPDLAVLYHLDGDGMDSSGHELHVTTDHSPFTGQKGPQGLHLAAGPFDQGGRQLARQLSEEDVARLNTQQFTIEAWICNPAALVDMGSEAMGVFQYRDSNTSRVSLRLDNELRLALAMQRADDGEFHLVTSRRALPLRHGQWWHVAVTYQGDGQGNDSIVRFYATPLGDSSPNLIDICRETPDVKPLTPGGTLRVGGLDQSENRCFGGQVDEVRYVNRVLKPGEMIAEGRGARDEGRETEERIGERDR